MYFRVIANRTYVLVYKCEMRTNHYKIGLSLFMTTCSMIAIVPLLFTIVHWIFNVPKDSSDSKRSLVYTGSKNS